MLRKLPEMIELERIVEEGSRHFDVRTVCEIDTDGRRFPVYVLSIGNPSPDRPAVGFFGGIHGLERIGTQVLLVFLRSLLTRLSWDDVLHQQLDRVRLVFMPLVNPGGMWQWTRCNPNGVDLMRNAPIEAAGGAPLLLGGQRISSRLAWYRGLPGAPMEMESEAVCTVVQEELLQRDFSLALDCHSGFGLRDRIWFPHAYTTAPMRNLPEMHALKSLFDATHPNHNYVFEPQSHQYLTHGDLWDYLYLRTPRDENRVFLPMTLEMGSWVWVKKNLLQLFSLHGIFNPLPAHRRQRVLRRHTVWLDFLSRAACGHKRWMPAGAQRARHRELALASWYGTSIR